MTEKTEEELTLWQLIKEDFSVPKQNDPALHSNLELFLIIQEFGL